MCQFIMLSTCLFLIPSVYACCMNVYPLSMVSIVTFIASMNYWYDPVPGYRKNIDIIIAWLDFLIYFNSGILYIHELPVHLLAWPNTLLILYLYQRSCKNALKRKNKWIVYHVLFHFAVVLNQCLIIQSIVKLRN
uniref:Uncharacterized protein n=1 Tax=viral metagenome TaxID=1070528 RepID=A0A6C0CTB5_9ZZZZ